MSTSLEAASAEFYAALNAMLGGDVEPMLALWSHADDITYMSPFGELLTGWEPVRASWQAQADAHLGGSVRAEEVRLVEGAGLGFAVGFERGEVHVEGRATAVDIRATSLYRHEDGGWRMIGHHTDPLG
jgi:ketosteroid isomerase-like protein